ncbi:unnamed protein product [Amoebophrya sp. A120]|nr:unnamed protein product [Amoebophrya sp. A120]|eukprot:GSA120T00014468001.1
MPRQQDACCKPTSLLCRCCCPLLAVFAWEGFSSNLWLACLCDTLGCPCRCLFALLWQPKGTQKRFHPVDAKKERKVYCCRCHPLDCCCHCWFPLHAIYAWQGCSSVVDILCVIVLNCLLPGCGCLYPVCCWTPADQQFIWGGDSAHVIGAPIVAGASREGPSPWGDGNYEVGNDDFDPITHSDTYYDPARAHGFKTYDYNRGGYYFYNDDEFVEEEEGDVHHRKKHPAAVLAQKKDKKVVAKGPQSSFSRNKGKVQPADEDGFIDHHAADDDEGEKFFKN